MYPGSRYLRQLAARASGGGEVKCELKGTPAGGVSTLPAIAPLPNAGVSTTSSATSEPFSKIDGVHIMSLGVSSGVAYEIPASEDVGGGVYLDPAVLEDTGGSGPASSSTFHDESIYRLPVRTQENIDMPKVMCAISSKLSTVYYKPSKSALLCSNSQFVRLCSFNCSPYYTLPQHFNELVVLTTTLCTWPNPKIGRCENDRLLRNTAHSHLIFIQ